MDAVEIVRGLCRKIEDQQLTIDNFEYKNRRNEEKIADLQAENADLKNQIASWTKEAELPEF